MIGTFAFLLLWIVAALALFLIAVSGGRRRARRAGDDTGAQMRSSRQSSFALFAAAFVALGVAVPTLVIAGSGNQRNTQRQSFATTCGTCHTLSAAGSTGTVGPNLDQLKPTVIRVQNALLNGGTGDGRMPAGLLTGAQADDMARYVATVAGKRSQ